MLIEANPSVRPITVNSSFTFTEDSYPHYRLLPVQTETGNDYCLFFYINPKDFLVLEPKIQRNLAIKKLAGYLKTATFAVYETI
ncbi:hypothetical protein [Neisseria sp. 83E34]|uniref:hypothetical protein n=1 Tax=Neisseria sp. 83E34 TaxID=1692264 RepID=UPI0006CE649F|nr:hypothetical protein [Neisseria sp. 83E34]KPN72669.1 lipopolysaccharide heptosyltransferase [Neisseria sp. 83E34]